jgi:hypothetical protein
VTRQRDELVRRLTELARARDAELARARDAEG